MYKYNDFDHAFVASRNAQFREQVNRRISGALSEDEFKPLRLMNGLYLQLHAYMLRVAIPYGTLNSRQMRQLAAISPSVGTRAMAISRPARTFSSIGPSLAMCPICSMPWPR
jgi:sulfite reductase beta subunit-like hemoprotein